MQLIAIIAALAMLPGIALAQQRPQPLQPLTASEAMLGRCTVEAMTLRAELAAARAEIEALRPRPPGGDVK